MKPKCILPAAIWLSSASLLFLPLRAQGEVVVAESTEWVLATSDRVLVGRVIKTEEVLDRANKKCDAITVAVSKTLKGEHTDRVTFVSHPFLYNLYAKQWMDEGIPFVFCLLKNDEKRVAVAAEHFPWVLRDNGNEPNAILLGKSKHKRTGCVPVLTRDFEVLTETEPILKFIEKTVKLRMKDGTPKSHTLHVPGNTPVYKLLWSGSAVLLTVPFDENLEVLGVKLCRSTSPDDRKEGAKILGYFKTQENIGILKTLLKDSTTAESTKHRSVPGKKELELIYRKKVYYVRQAAFDALRKLGVKIERPVLEELLEGRDGLNEGNAADTCDRLQNGMSEDQVTKLVGRPPDRGFHPWDYARFLASTGANDTEWEMVWFGQHFGTPQNPYHSGAALLCFRGALRTNSPD